MATTWEDEEFGDEDYWTVGSLQAVHRAPPGREGRGGQSTLEIEAPRGRNQRCVLTKPIPTTNRWKVIAPDNDEDYEPNNVKTGLMIIDAINFPRLPPIFRVNAART